MQKGHKLKKSDLTCKRPATGISPMQIKKVLGKKIKKNLKEDVTINWIDIK